MWVSSSAGLRSLAAPVRGLLVRCDLRLQRLRRVAAVLDGTRGPDGAERFHAEMTALMEERYRVIRRRIRPGVPPPSAGWRAVLGLATGEKSASGGAGVAGSRPAAS